MSHLVVIGGSDAGISAGLRALEVDPSWEVTLLVADRYPNFSICGLPFYLSGETPDWTSLAHRTRIDLEAAGLQLRLDHRADAVDPRAHRVSGTSPAGTFEVSYDRLVIATGATPVRPAFAALDDPDVHVLHTMDDAFELHARLERSVDRAVIVGAGYIGLEMADALRHRGVEVQIFERGPEVLPAVDPELAHLVAGELAGHGVRVRTNAPVREIRRHRGSLLVRSDGVEAAADVVLVVAGVRPDAALGMAAGVPVGTRGALQVDRAMRTTLPDILAAGDCAETFHRLLGPTYLPLGTTSHKQGRVAGENAVGGARHFAGTLGTQVVKVFDLAIARTGLRDGEATGAGFSPRTNAVVVDDHKGYYPGACPLSIRVTGDWGGRLLGAQIVGDRRSEVAKRIDVYATALFHEMSVDALSDLDLSYTPPFGSPWDAVQMAAQDWTRSACFPGAFEH